MLSVSVKLYDLPNDILDNICYKNDLDNKKLAQIIKTNKSLRKFIMIKYKKLYLSNFQELQINMNHLDNIYEVDLYNCLGIIDTYMFKNCKILKLRSCHNIYDVSQLGNIEYLDLSNCYEISNISMLGKCCHLKLSNCNKITDISKLGNVDYLDLSHCDKITDISKLGNHKYLSLRGCHKITNINNLGKVHTLDLGYCENIRDISCLKNVYDLDVSFSSHIKINEFMNNTIFKAIKTNLINDDVIFLKNIKNINIKNCYWIYDLSPLINVEILDIKGCKNIKTLPETSTLKKLNVSCNAYSIITNLYKINKEKINLDYFE